MTRLLQRLSLLLRSGPDLPELHRLLTPACRSGGPGMTAQLVASSGGYQVARWVERIGDGGDGILADLGLIFGSYRPGPRCSLTAVDSRLFHRTALVRARLHCQGLDWADWRRADDGVLDLRLVRGPAGWRIDRMTPAWIGTVRREERGYPTLSQSLPVPPSVGLAAMAEGSRPGSPSLPAGAAISTGLLQRDSATLSLIEARGHTVSRVRLDPAGGLAGERELLFATREPARVLATADLDGNGRADLLVSNRRAGIQTWLQSHNRQFERSSALASSEGAATVAALADFDRDGWLDAFVVRRAAAAGGAAVVVFGAAGGVAPRPPLELGLRARRTERKPPAAGGAAVCLGDLDRNGWPDAVVVDQRGTKLWLNRGGALVASAGRTEIARARGHACAIADIDGDHRLDLLIGGASAGPAGARTDATVWYNRRIPGRSVIRWRPSRLWGAGPASGAALFDHDNDGDLDLWLWSGGGGRRGDTLWVNSGGGSFGEAGWVAGLASRSGGGTHLVYDLNHDGALDLYSNGLGVAGWRGGAGDWGEEGATHGVLLRLRALGRGNRDGIGARVELRSSNTWQLREIGSTSAGLSAGPAGHAHFGVGSDVRVIELLVRWPDGSMDRYPDLPVDRLITLTQGGGARWQDLRSEAARR